MQPELVLDGSEIRATTPEGVVVAMPLAALFGKLAGYRNSAQATVLPDGIKAVFERGPMQVWVHEIPPCVRRLRWIASTSRRKFGPGTRYCEVAISLPYVEVLGVFAPARGDRLTLAMPCECFFRNQPLESPDDQLLFPALLNCSKFEPEEGNPLAWICTQHIDRGFDAEPDTNKRLRLGFKALLSCLFDTGFNYSSEHHEASSWFTESQGVDPRVSSIEAWQEATAADPLFAVEVPWLPTGRSLGQVVERIFDNHGAGWPSVADAGALARFVINHAEDPQPEPEPEPEPAPEPEPEPGSESPSDPDYEQKQLDKIIEQLGIF